MPSTIRSALACVLLASMLGCAGSPCTRVPRRTAVVRPATPAPLVVAAAPTAPSCRPLPTGAWTFDPLLQVHEATTCRYRITWAGWSPPRDYTYEPDPEGWVSDYFIAEGVHARVFWNLASGAAWVRPMQEGQTLGLEEARQVAGWARATNFPGLDLATVQLNPAPCGEGPCGPR